MTTHLEDFQIFIYRLDSEPLSLSNVWVLFSGTKLCEKYVKREKKIIKQTQCYFTPEENNSTLYISMCLWWTDSNSIFVSSCNIKTPNKHTHVLPKNKANATELEHALQKSNLQRYLLDCNGCNFDVCPKF